MFMVAIQAQATPIRPDLQKLLAQPQEATMRFAPARAGWQGPENSATVAAGPANTVLDQSADVRVMRRTLLAVAIPDPRLVVAIVVALFVLRRVRGHRWVSTPPAREESPLNKAA